MVGTAMTSPGAPRTAPPDRQACLLSAVVSLAGWRPKVRGRQAALHQLGGDGWDALVGVPGIAAQPEGLGVQAVNHGAAGPVQRGVMHRGAALRREQQGDIVDGSPEHVMSTAPGSDPDLSAWRGLTPGGFMGIILLVLLLALILGGLGFVVHVLWWIAVVVLVIWLIGFVVRVGEGTSRRRWYRWLQPDPRTCG